MDDSFDLFDSDEDEEVIDLSSIQYKEPVEKPNKKDVKSKEKAVEKQSKIDDQMKKQLVKRVTNKSKKETPTEKEVVDKRKLIILLSYYLLEFPEKLKCYKKVNLEKKTYEELKDLYKEFKITLGNKSSVSMGVKGLSMTIQMMELVMLNFTPINCAGLSNICNDPDTIDLMKEITLKNCSLIEAEPEHRLLYNLMMTTMALHTYNTANGPGKNNEDIIKNVNSQYVDI